MLHSQMRGHEQRKAFDPVPAGKRRIVSLSILGSFQHLQLLRFVGVVNERGRSEYHSGRRELRNRYGKNETGR